MGFFGSEGNVIIKSKGGPRTSKAMKSVNRRIQVQFTQNSSQKFPHISLGWRGKIRGKGKQRLVGGGRNEGRIYLNLFEFWDRHCMRLLTFFSG